MKSSARTKTHPFLVASALAVVGCTVTFSAITQLDNWWSPYTPVDPDSNPPYDFAIVPGEVEDWGIAIVPDGAGVWTRVECFSNLGQPLGFLKFKAPYEVGFVDGLPDTPGAWVSVGWRPDPSNVEWTAGWIVQVNASCGMAQAEAIPPTWNQAERGQPVGLAVTNDGEVGLAFNHYAQWGEPALVGLVVYDPAADSWDANLDVPHGQTPMGSIAPILRHDASHETFALSFGNDITELKDTTLALASMRTLDTTEPITTWDVYAGYTQVMRRNTSGPSISQLLVFDPTGAQVAKRTLPYSNYGAMRGAREPFGPLQDMRMRSWVLNFDAANNNVLIDTYETNFSIQ